jgi:hypothetical protein
MKEGTWMLGKPKRNTPPSQDKGTPGRVGVWRDPTQTPAHHLKKSSNLRNPGADWNLQGRCCRNQDDNCCSNLMLTWTIRFT